MTFFAFLAVRFCELRKAQKLLFSRSMPPREEFSGTDEFSQEVVESVEGIFKEPPMNTNISAPSAVKNLHDLL